MAEAEETSGGPEGGSTPPPAAGEQGAAGAAAPPPSAGETSPTAATSDPGAPAGVPADWPEDWRAKLAGEDAKLLARLQRFGAPGDILKSWLNAEKRISTGAPPAPFPAEGTDEEKTAWRAANGVPDSWEKYDTTLPGGLVLGEEDKPIIDSFLQAAHADNLPPAAVKVSLQWYHAFQQQQQESQYARDVEQRDEGIQTLRQEWGPEFKGNQNAIRGWLDSVGEGLADRLFGARDSEGKLLGNDPGVLRWLANTARELNPAATVLPGSLASAGKGIDDRIAEIETMMRTDSKAYYRNDAVQAELRRLYEAREKRSKG